MRVLHLQLFHDVLAALCWKGGQTFAPSPRLFLPCTWLSPEAEICHLWSLLRWMLLAPSLQVTAQKNNHCIFWGKDVSNDSTQSEWAWKIILSDEVENVPLWHFFPLSFVGISCTKSRHRGSKLPITLTKLWPLAFYWEATLCAAERDICSHG